MPKRKNSPAVVRVKVRTVTEYVARLTATDIIRLLGQDGVEVDIDTQQVLIRIPEGHGPGDDLVIDDEAPVLVIWREINGK